MAAADESKGNPVQEPQPHRFAAHVLLLRNLLACEADEADMVRKLDACDGDVASVALVYMAQSRPAAADVVPPNPFLWQEEATAEDREQLMVYWHAKRAALKLPWAERVAVLQQPLEHKGGAGAGAAGAPAEAGGVRTFYLPDEDLQSALRVSVMGTGAVLSTDEDTLTGSERMVTHSRQDSPLVVVLDKQGRASQVDESGDSDDGVLSFTNGLLDGFGLPLKGSGWRQLLKALGVPESNALYGLREHVMGRVESGRSNEPCPTCHQFRL